MSYYQYNEEKILSKYRFQRFTIRDIMLIIAYLKSHNL